MILIQEKDGMIFEYHGDIDMFYDEIVDGVSIKADRVIIFDGRTAPVKATKNIIDIHYCEEIESITGE